MHIVFFMTNDSVSYSGGRYHAVLMAEALAAAGHKITICTDNKPVFYDEFQNLPAHDSIRLMLSPYLHAMPQEEVDLVVVIPQSGYAPWLYSRALAFAREREARVALLNFESPNWFNEYSPEPRDVENWKGWVDVSRSADLILSSAAESTRYAKEFYDETPGHALFEHCHPPVNSVAADAVEEPPKRKQVLCLTRTGEKNAHKGGHELLRALCPALRGYTLLLMVGRGQVDEELLDQLKTRAREVGARIEVAYRLTDKEKFKRIKESAMMLFLSHFEGFGYPPVESQYCNVPCVVYDLPVLREVSGDGLIYVQPGDDEALRAAIAAVLSNEQKVPQRSLSERIAPKVDFASRTEAFNASIERVARLEAPPAAVTASAETARQWQSDLFRWRLECSWNFMRTIIPRAPHLMLHLTKRLALKAMIVAARPVRPFFPELVESVKRIILGETEEAASATVPGPSMPEITKVECNENTRHDPRPHGQPKTEAKEPART